MNAVNPHWERDAASASPLSGFFRGRVGRDELQARASPSHRRAREARRLLRGACGKLHGRRRAASPRARANPHRSSDFASWRLHVDRRPGAPRRRSSRSLPFARRALRTRLGIRASRLVDARDHLLQRPAAAAVHGGDSGARRATISTRSRTPSVGRSCSKILRPTLPSANPRCPRRTFFARLSGAAGADCCSTSTTSSYPRRTRAIPPQTILAEFPMSHVGEIHLAGHAEQTDDEGDPAPDRQPRSEGRRSGLDTFRERGRAMRTRADTGRMGQQHSRMVRAASRGRSRTGNSRSPCSRYPQVCQCWPLTSLESTQTRTPSYAAVLAPGLIDPEYETPAGVVGPNGKGAVKRYNVYRNNVTVSLIDALAAVFPATQRITGVEFFRAMARFHVRATPPRSPLLFEYGREFPDFIERYEYARPMPYLADTARIERAWLDAYHAADESPLAAQNLAAIPPEIYCGRGVRRAPGDTHRSLPVSGPVDLRRESRRRAGRAHRDLRPGRHAGHASRPRGDRASPAAGRRTSF